MSRILLLSTYEQGHQPLGLAAPAAALRAEGHDVACIDLAVDQLAPERLTALDLVGVSVPMHTAARLGVQVARQVRQFNANVRIVFYGLYASELHEHLTQQGIADHVVGGEYEVALCRIATMPPHAPSPPGAGSVPLFPRRRYAVPDRSGLPPLTEYARFDPGRGDLRLAGYVEATRGCAHRCTHCPLTPTYGGRLRLVQPEVVLADIEQQVDAGARHITFGDPDFLNAVPHADAITAELHHRHPDLTFDATIKVEHLLEQVAFLPRLQERGLAFVTSAFESVDDRLLRLLDKGHTADDLGRVLADATRLSLPIRPTWLPFTPWTTLDDLAGILRFVDDHALAMQVQPVQYALRLLLPPGSPLVQAAAQWGALTGFDADGLSHTWRHPDPAMDALQERLARYTAEAAAGATHADRASSDAVQFDWIWEAVRSAGANLAAASPAGRPVLTPRAPGLTEAWFC